MTEAATRGNGSAGAFGRAAQLDWWNLFFRPLLTTEQAAELLDDLHKRHVVTLSEEGRLHAINIALATDTRRELRVFRYSVEWLGESDRRKTKAPRHPEVALLLPHGRANFLLREVKDFLQCSEQHVRNLAIGGPQFSERHNRVSRAALTEFLTTREVR